METTEVGQVPIKNETSFTESSQESKVEQIPNGTVQSSTTSEKTVSQSVESNVQPFGEAKPIEVAAIVPSTPQEPIQHAIADTNGQVQPEVQVAPVVSVPQTAPVEVAPVVQVAPVVSVPQTAPVEVAPVVQVAPVVSVPQTAPVEIAPVVQVAPAVSIPQTAPVEVAPVVQVAPAVSVPQTAPVEVAPVVQVAPVVSVPQTAPVEVVPVVQVAPVVSVPQTAPVEVAPVVQVAPAAPVVQLAPIAPLVQAVVPIVQQIPIVEPVVVQQPIEQPIVVQQPVQQTLQEKAPEQIIANGNVVTGDGLLVECVEPIVQQQPIIAPIVQQSAPVVVPQPIIAPVEVQQPIIAPVSEALLIIAPQVSAPAPAPVAAPISQPPPIVAAAAVIPDVYNNNTVINAPQPKEPEILKQSFENNKEIQQESIKKQLNEIITDIEKNVNVNDDYPTDNLNKSYSYSEEKFKSSVKRSTTSSINKNSVIMSNRGFKPSDRHDPNKKSFLLDLSKKIWTKRDAVDGKKPIDLQKIFTPATDVDEILPGKNRKLFASSCFYTPGLHPTVEDQIELAQRISHSLSDISNHTSKGQDMYVNRKKRSVKWIHDDGREEERFIDEPKKVPLKLLMDPRHVQDMNTMSNQIGYEAAPMSPEFGYEIVNALNATKGKGAELFAKRRRKAEKWIVDAANTVQQRHQAGAIQTPGVAPIQAFSDVGKQRVQQNMMMDQIQQNYGQPRVQMVRSPWDAALETGSANNAFASYEQNPNQQQQSYTGTAGQAQNYDYGSTSNTSSMYSSSKKDVQYQPSTQIKEQLSARDLAYKPTVPQGWQRPVSLPSGMFNVPELPIMSTSTSSFTSENMSKYSSNQCVSELPAQTVPLTFAPAQQQSAPQQNNLQQNQTQQQFNQYQQTSSSSVTSMTSKTYQQTSSSSSSSTTAKTFMPQIVKTLPQTMSPKSPIQRNDAVSSRSGMNASPVTPGILKMQIKLDAAVPVPPGGLAPPPSQCEPQFQNPIPLPLITSTEIPNYSSNYNTAARPFGQCKDYYRPIHMEEAKKMHPPVIYTDF
ncbi:unnamed protein product [Diamesa serratosioi]